MAISVKKMSCCCRGTKCVSKFSHADGSLIWSKGYSIAGGCVTKIAQMEYDAAYDQLWFVGFPNLLDSSFRGYPLFTVDPSSGLVNKLNTPADSGFNPSVPEVTGQSVPAHFLTLDSSGKGSMACFGGTGGAYTYWVTFANDLSIYRSTVSAGGSAFLSADYNIWPIDSATVYNDVTDGITESGRNHQIDGTVSGGFYSASLLFNSYGHNYAVNVSPDGSTLYAGTGACATTSSQATIGAIGGGSPSSSYAKQARWAGSGFVVLYDVVPSTAANSVELYNISSGGSGSLMCTVSTSSFLHYNSSYLGVLALFYSDGSNFYILSPDAASAPFTTFTLRCFSASSGSLIWSAAVDPLWSWAQNPYSLVYSAMVTDGNGDVYVG